MQLALHRIQSAEQNDIATHRPEGFALVDYVSDAQEFSYPTGAGAIKLVFLMDEPAALHLLERPLSDDQADETQSDGRVKITAKVLDTDELTWWLLGFGSRVEVLSPSHVRSRLGESLRNACALYG